MKNENSMLIQGELRRVAVEDNLSGMRQVEDEGKEGSK